ncbi:glycosyltransferase 61 family protein [Parvularcula dongshanensis]|uniref:Glycosyltransferase family 61 protein n=1 Tax=Parvularcula dongshanensis TaxID=1173995 RepID=A0A840I0E8_9PROT|nr:glycosyltransferase 61 family protein [Parvularcula dongshanensis]MBB4658177.1 hypothetical protein [Parvularcula dongshanensis]
MAVGDWRDRSVKARATIAAKKALAALHARTGRLEPRSPADMATHRVETVSFLNVIGGEPTDASQGRLAFDRRRPQTEEARGLFYSPAGMAWHHGALRERWSIRAPSAREILARPPARARTVRRAAIVESDLPYTYGDWVHAVLGPLLAGPALDRPLLLPGFLAEKGYVRRDLATAGIDYEAMTDWVRVEDALILRKTFPLQYWAPEHTAAYRSVFEPDPPEPAPGSIVYLGRFDLKSEIGRARFPSERVAEAAGRLGASVVRQETLSPETSRALAGGVETVIGDHGSGLLNMLHWRPKAVIELTVDGWWVNNNLFVAKQLGVEDYAVLPVDGLGAEEIEQRLQACLARFEGRRA